MATLILATGSTVASSSPLTVTSAIAVSLKGVTGADADVNIELQDDAGSYVQVGELNSSQPATMIVAPGVYRFTRTAGTCGVFSA